MKISDLLWMAIKNLKFRSKVIPALAMAISVFCLCFAGAVFVSVQQEKSLPYELEVTSNSAEISENVLAEISAIPDVTAVTPVLQVPVSIHAGQYKADLTLIGIDAAYIHDAFSQGGVFSDSSVMPYIVLNKAACKLFADEKGDGSAGETDEPQLDWLNTTVTVQTSESVKPVISKIVGLLSGDSEDQEPAAYISAASAKELLRREGQSTDNMNAAVRVKNIGSAAAVSAQITMFGFSVLNANEDVQAKWDLELEEMTFLIVIGIFGLVCSALLATARRKADILEQKETFSALQWAGMKSKDIGHLFMFQTLMTVLLGVSLGIVVGASLPAFLEPEAADTSIFALQIPFGIAAVSAAIGIVSGILPFLKFKYVQ